MLEGKFAVRTQDQRKELLYGILKRYSELPTVHDLDNIERDLTWEDFCKWVAERSERQRQLEAEFSDFVEDQREKEGR